MKERFLIKFEKRWTGTLTATINDKVEFFAMRGQAWGIGIELDPLDKSLTIHLLCFYVGVTVFYE
jgi:hypothetical protein